MKKVTFEDIRMGDIGKAPLLHKEGQYGDGNEFSAPENSSQQQFENDFSGISFQFMQDRAPSLMPYMLGFEVVDQERDGSKAVGIYGFKIGKDFYYVPVFFINNQVRGMDMILNKRTNNFMPLTEEWVDHIINRHSVELGKPAPENVRERIEQPDLSFLKEPNVGPDTKSAEASDADVPWTLRDAWENMKYLTEKMAQSDPELRSVFRNLVRKVKTGKVEKSAESRFVKGFMSRIGGPSAMRSLMKSFSGNMKTAEAALSLYDGIGAFYTDDLSGAFILRKSIEKKAASRPKIRVVGSVSDLSKNASDTPPTDVGRTDESPDDDSDLTPEENARQIIGRGFTITDARADGEASVTSRDADAVSFESVFGSPAECGKYSFVMSDGKVREGFLLNSVIKNEQTCCRDCECVYFPEGKVIRFAKPKNMLTVGSFTKGVDELFDTIAVDLGSVEIDRSRSGKSNEYMFIGRDGTAVGPFIVRSVVNNGNETYFTTGYDGAAIVDESEKHDSGHDFGGWDLSDRFHDIDGRHNSMCNDSLEAYRCIARIKFSPSLGTAKRRYEDVIIPSGWKAVKIYKNGNETNGETLEEQDEKAHSMYTFATPSELFSELSESGIGRVKAASDAGGFTLQIEGYRPTKTMTYKQASVTLVTKLGFRPRAAFGLLDDAEMNGSGRAIYKSAQSRMVGVSMQSPIEPSPSVDDYTGIPVYNTPYTDSATGIMTNVPSLPPDGGLTRGIAAGSEIQRSLGSAPSVENPEDSEMPIDQQSAQLAQDAANAGQKHVFDQAAIGGLSKVYDTSAVIDSYIPNFMDTLDRLGRTLFLFYWKHEDFTGRYGSDDVVKMEDLLRSVFKQLGTLTLDLNEKAVDAAHVD